MAENKMEQVATVNNFDKLIGKNGELAELRKEQVLAGAIGIIRRQYAGRNKMEAIAALFDKKLGEEFFVWLNGEYTINAEVNSIWRMKFMHRGLYIYIPNGGPDGGWWAFNRPVLSDLLTGKAEIMEAER